MASVQTAFDLLSSGDLAAAEEEARSALAAGDHPGLRHLLGVLLCRRGSLDEGAAELGRALELAPANPGVRISYVRALIDLGRSGEALRHARRPAPGPQAVELWRLRAEAAQAAGALTDRAEALHCADFEATQAALAERPSDLELRLRGARLLGMLMRDEEAERAYRDILRDHPAHSEVVHDLGLILERGNRVGEVQALVDSAVAGGCEPAELALLEAFLAWRDSDPDKVLEWLSQPAAARDERRSYQLEAKAQDALGNFDAAFKAAQAANDAVADRDQWRLSAATFRSELRHLAGMITPNWSSSWSPAAPGRRRAPVFLVGFPRSGTTLLDTLLMGHSQVTMVEEVPALGLVAERLGSLTSVADLDDEAADKLRQYYFKQIDMVAGKGSGGLVVDKLPLNMLFAPLIYRLFPDSKIIFAQRHPCDCVLSAFFQSFGMNPAMACFLDIRDSADLYDCAMQVWTASRSALPLDVHTLGYERMVE
ncbi:MAG: sulfotransferase, partial [Sphingomonas sp.]|nr:sulfotransferase [Sphingomonas sp.]